MINKYDRYISNKDFNAYLDSTKNKIYKLLPLREEGLQWEKFLNTILIEFNGFESVMLDEAKMISTISKLEGLYFAEDFTTYRKTIFECLGSIEELKRGASK